MAAAKIGKDNKAVTVILSMDTYEALKSWAENKDWSVSQAARNLIEAGLDPHLGISKADATKSRKRKP